ncbi:MAG: hypothetical protein J2P13_00900 [Acidobacteria bacterium]|nr:hypothetical protein [Acidobacteriota bacterium]
MLKTCRTHQGSEVRDSGWVAVIDVNTVFDPAEGRMGRAGQQYPAGIAGKCRVEHGRSNSGPS